MHASILGRRPRSLVTLVAPVIVIGLTAAAHGFTAETLLAASPAAPTQAAPAQAPAAPATPDTWESRSRSGEAAGRSVTADLSPEASILWLRALAATETALDELTGASALPPRILPTRQVLFFTDDADFRRVLQTTYGQELSGDDVVRFDVGSQQTLAAVVPADEDVAAGAARVLPIAGAQWLERWFQADLPPALDAGLELFLADTTFVGDRPMFGRARAETLIPAQVIARDRTPNLFGLLSLDDEGWSGLTAEERADGTLAIWSMLQFAAGDDGGGMRRGLRAFLRAVNAGSLPADALQATFATADAAALQSQWRRWIERAIPDPITVAMPRVEALIDGLAMLSAEGISPKHLDEAAAELSGRNFVWESVRWGEPQRLAITGPDVFVLPEDTRTGRRARIDLDPGRITTPRSSRPAADGPVAPPRIRVRGLARGTVQVEWEQQADGTFAAEVKLTR
ncbi:MAG: hypothetical protein AB8G96_16570 [Phycisphaerales bacterium]